MVLKDNKYLLFCTIVDFGMGSKMVKEAKHLGAKGATLFLGRGTVNSSLLHFLGLHEIRKEILMIIIEEELEDIIYDGLNNKFSLDKPHHGIAFSMPLKNCIAYKFTKCIENPETRGVENMKHDAIFTIVDKGLSDEVIDAAKSAGATGGTVIHGRGSGSAEKALLFNFEIEPEKDIILILSNSEKTDMIIDSISEKLKIDEPGKGIIFTMEVTRTLGLFKE
ncbi:MAG: P-II family nitrogen regulator [Tissierellaceae bacterium]|nr:P-II family nitrogen regulator [Tissierellaceae bacterium]